jgi:hypothetical protein
MFSLVGGLQSRKKYFSGFSLKARFGNRGLRHRPICYTGRLGSFLYVSHYVKITAWDREGLIYWDHQDLFINSYVHSFIHSPFHSFRSVIRQVHSLFQSELSTECDVVLSLSISSIPYAFLRPSNSCLCLLSRVPVLSLFPSIACCRWQFLCKVLSIQLALLRFIVRVIFLWTASVV